MMQVKRGVRRRARRRRAMLLCARRGRQDVITGEVRGNGRMHWVRGGRAGRRVGVVRAGVGAEAGDGQRGAMRGRAHGRLTTRARQRRRVVQRAH